MAGSDHAAAATTAADSHAADDAAAQRLIRRTLAQWPLILACALIAAIAGGLASASRTEQFEATTTMQLNEIDFTAAQLGQNLRQSGSDTEVKTATQAKLVTMPGVRTAAATTLGGRADADAIGEAVTVTTEPGTTLISITARSADPRLAADMANALRDAFIADRRESATRQALSVRDSVQAELEKLPASQQDSIAAQTLQQRLASLNTIVDAGSGVSTANPAEVPTVAVSPNPKRDAILALIAGGLLGLGIALLRARLDDHVRRPDELTEAWDIPLLGAIPETKDLARGGRRLPAGSALEAFALARTNLRYLHVEGELKTLVVTSALAEEGKSTVVWNLAVASALAESKVLVIDADLRRPMVAARLGLPAATGLSEVLAGMADVDDVIQTVEIGTEGSPMVSVDVLPSGFVPPSPTALLERESTGALLRELSGRYDLVLVDTPPATVVADAKILLDHVDGAVVVSRLGRVTRPALEQLRELLGGLETPVLGVIVNSGAAATAYGYEPYAQTGPVAAPAPAAT